MKIIDLLNKAANGEEVPLIKYRDKILHWNKEKDRFEDKDGMNTLYEIDFSELNDEVEIIEEYKIIEKLGKYANVSGDLVSKWNFAENKLKDKINEIIDYIMEE